MSNFQNATINVGTNYGVILQGDHNTIDLNELALSPPELQRIEAAMAAVGPGAVTAPDAAELKHAVTSAATPEARESQVKRWLLKIAPTAAGVAGSLLNPALGKVAEQLASWVAHKLDGNA